MDPALKSPGETGASLGNRLVEAWQQASEGGREREDLFRQIFEAYYRSVYSFFRKKGCPPEECEELAQDTFVKVHKGLTTFRRDSRFETWLFKITLNVFNNTVRSRKTQKREAVEVSLDIGAGPGTGTEPSTASPMPGWSAEADPLSGVLTAEQSQMLRAALDELPPQMRRCVLMRIDRDLRYREIAVLLRVSIETVKAHLYQARQQLKSKLGPYFVDFSD